MTLDKWERQNIFRTSVTWKSGNVEISPSGNMSFLDVIKSDGTYLVYGDSSQKDSTGTFKYYVSASSTDPLGIYIMDHYAYFSYPGRWGYQKKHDKFAVQMCFLDQ